MEVIKFEIGSDCICEDYNEDTDTSTPSTECFGCWQDEAENFKYEILKPWLAENGWDTDTAVRIEASNLGWLRQRGYKETTAGDVLESLTLNGDFTLRFELDGKTLTCVRSSHDELGAMFEVVESVEVETD